MESHLLLVGDGFLGLDKSQEFIEVIDCHGHEFIDVLLVLEPDLLLQDLVNLVLLKLVNLLPFDEVLILPLDLLDLSVMLLLESLELLFSILLLFLL